VEYLRGGGGLPKQLIMIATRAQSAGKSFFRTILPSTPGSAGIARSVLAAESRRYDDDVSSGCYGGSSRLMDAVVS